MAFAASSLSSVSSNVMWEEKDADTASSTTTTVRGSTNLEQSRTLHDSSAGLSSSSRPATAAATEQILFAPALPLGLHGLPTTTSASATFGVGRARSRDGALRSMNASGTVTPSTGSLPPSPPRRTVSVAPPPPLVGSARKALKAGGHGVGGSGGVGGASPFRDWSTNAALLDEVLDTPVFRLLPRSGASVAARASTSAAPTPAPQLDSSPLTLPPSTPGDAAAAAAAVAAAAATRATVSRESIGSAVSTRPNSAGVYAPRGGEAAPALAGVEAGLSLPSVAAPLPSILLIALADMEALQQSLCAHTLVAPVKDQLLEFKRLVAASMKAELVHQDDGPRADAAVTEAPSATTNTTTTAAAAAAAAPPRPSAADDASAAAAATAAAAAVAARGVVDEGAAGDSVPIASALQAHDAAVRAALRAAHGFLYGTESVPVGVPAAHLHSSRREWVAQYRVTHVQPRLQLIQRRRYEAWAQRSPAAVAAAADVNPAMPPYAGAAVPSGGATTAIAVCAALAPSYWRTATGERPAAAPVSPAARGAPPAAGNGAANGGSGGESGGGTRAYTPPPAQRPWSSAAAAAATAHTIAAAPQSHSAAKAAKAVAAAAAAAYTAAWDVDLYDDLGLAVSAEQRDTLANQATSRTAVETMELDEAATDRGRTAGVSSAPAAATSSAPLVALAAPPLLLGRAGDLTQMQVALPAFVYVVSRFLFNSHYAVYFPAALFSRALIDPFYFPSEVECTADYALRATPALRREAHRIHSAYAAQLADAHRCFPDRVQTTEVPLPQQDVLHLWELLCPPQRQDVAGRWRPVPWGALSPQEEEVLLDAEYTSGGGGDGRVPPREAPLLSYAYARAARRSYRRRLQLLAQHPVLLAEVRRLLTNCEDVALQFFAMVDTEQKGCITWEAFTNALIEEADVQDHQRKVRDRAAHLTRASASVFDRYVVEPLASTLVRLGYTANVFEVRHSVSLVMLEGSTDYAVCDGAQLGSIHQRFLVRPVEVVCKELEGEPRDALGRLIHSIGGGNADGSGGRRGGGGGAAAAAVGYDAALRQRPWRNNQRPRHVFLRYEDGRRLQESTALSVLQQLSGSSSAAAAAEAATSQKTGGGGGSDDDDDDAAAFTSSRAHQPVKAVSLEGVMVVEDVTPCVPWPVFIARGNDMLLRLYGTNRAVQALPEAGVLRCVETVTSMEWAAGGRPERRSSIGGTSAPGGGAAASPGARPPSSSSASSSSPAATAAAGATRGGARASLSLQRRTQRDRISVQRQEYVLLGTRSGTVLLVDLYALLHHIPRLATAPVSHGGGETGAAAAASGSGGGGGDAVGGGGGGGVASTMGATGAAVNAPPISERIGSSESAWTGYRALAQRTYYGDIAAFVVHSRQVHVAGTLVSSVVAAAGSGLIVSGGLDGDVVTMRLAYPPARVGATATVRAAAAAAAVVGGGGADVGRPLVRLEVLHRMRVCDTGVRHAMPIPFLSMLAVHTATNKVYLYHASVLPTAPALTEGGRSAGGGEAASTVTTPRASPDRHEAAAGDGGGATSAAASATPPRLELYDASAPHLGVIVTMIVVEELDQFITVDSSGYVKVWSLRQTQPLTSFCALAPLQTSGGGERTAAASQGGGGGGGGGGSSGGGGVAASGVPAAPSALLRTTKNSIEAAVDASEYRQQPCRSAAYNYAGRQLFVLGSHNAAHCFFLSGQSSARAHTEPLRVLLVDTTTVSRVGCVHRRLITLSSADCRLWSLLSGAMELGIRANNAEYRHLFDHRLTGNARGKTAKSDAGNAREERQSGSRGRRAGRRPLTSHPPRQHSGSTSGAAAAAAPSAMTTGEARRLLPPSVDDVMRAVSARPWSSHHRIHPRRPATSSSTTRAGAAAAAASSSATTAPSQLLTAVKQPHGHSVNNRHPLGVGVGVGLTTHGDGAEDDGDGLVTSVMRDQNRVLSDIRCACLGPGGQWIGYALLHGDIRLHRSDSGRLLHTFITTPPSIEDLVEAAMQYQHLFSSISAPSTAAAAAAPAPRPASVQGGAHMTASAPPPQQQQPTARLTPAAYAQAVALVLQQLLASTTGSLAGSGGGGGESTTGGGAAAPASSGDADDRLGRNVHREPLHMLYLDASQELLVAYADGLLRSFTPLSHSTTASRIVVSRTLMHRALAQVRRVLTSHTRHAHTARPAGLLGAASPLRGHAAPTHAAGGASTVPLQELLLTGAAGGVVLGDGDASEGRSSVSVAGVTARAVSRAARGDAAGGGTATGATASPTAASFVATLPLAAPPPANPMRALMAALPTRQIEPDVVLLATASPPLGLVCLVHASGLVTVLDVQSHSEKGAGVRARMMASDDGDEAGPSGAYGEAAGAGAESSTGGERARAGVVVHSFTTVDEVTAAVFLGAYPCLVLADRQHQLSFHLMKGSSMLALLGEFAEQLERDAVAAQELHLEAEAPHGLAAWGWPADGRGPTHISSSGGGSGGGGRGGGAEPTATSAASPTLAWTVCITDTCASQHALGYVTVLNFDPLYATVYVGTSQGYVISYLVRRFLTAFQLTPVYLRGVDGVAVSTYAAELQRHMTVARPGAATVFLQNFLRIVFDVPATVAAQVAEPRRRRGPETRRNESSADPSTAATTPTHEAREVGGLLGVYEARRTLFHTSWRGAADRRHGGGGGGGGHSSAVTAAPPPFITLTTAGDALTAAAVMHDAVLRMMSVASRRSAAASPEETPPWWCTPAGRTVQSYITRVCGGGGGGGGVDGVAGGAKGHNTAIDCGDAAPPAMAAALELDAEGTQLLRGWVAAALAQQRRYQQPHASDAQAVAGVSPSHHHPPTTDSAHPREMSSNSSCTSSSGFTALPLASTTRDALRSRPGADGGADGGGGGGVAALGAATVTAQELAEALVHEVQEELLVGEAAAATVSAAAHAKATSIPAASPPPLHAITDAWVECLFTRQTMCTTSRSPLCLLTPPAMLERARRERHDRLGRVAAAGGLSGAPEWDAYVEGALPDYLADMLRHPGQVLTEVERQALQQRAVTALQCRRNGYLCVGHADGGVTLWTPYACARLESLCPSTSLAATLDRLAASVAAQFHSLHERIVLERKRLAFEGSLHNTRQSEEEGAVRMKQRIRSMLLDHHLAQLGSERAGDAAGTEGGAGAGSELQSPQSTPGARALPVRRPVSPEQQQQQQQQQQRHSHAKGATHPQPFMGGHHEARLLAMRPLLCLLLGVSSPAELRARQLSLEDLCFLPFHARSIASLEAFDARCYDAAVAVAMRRLRRELVDEGDEGATEESADARHGPPDALTAAVTQALSPTTTEALPPAAPAVQSSGAQRHRGGSGGRRGRHQPPPQLDCVYDYRLASLLRAWADTAARGAVGAAAFPGSTRLLLHRAMEGAPHSAAVAAAAAVVAAGMGDAQAGRLGSATTHRDGSASASRSSGAAADGAAPSDGEYYIVCHALQLAEVQTEAQWEVEELSRAWHRLQLSPAPTSPRTAPAAAARAHDGGTLAGSSLAQLPPTSAAALSAAVDRQVRRGLEARVAALSCRAVATAALLRGVQLHGVAAPALSPRGPVSDVAGAGYSMAAPPPPPAPRRGGGGLAWVQATLRHQAQHAFAEPLLRWASVPHMLSSSLAPSLVSTALSPTRTAMVGAGGPLCRHAAAAAFMGDGTASPHPTHALPHVLHGGAAAAADEPGVADVFLTAIPDVAGSPGSAAALVAHDDDEDNEVEVEDEGSPFARQRRRRGSPQDHAPSAGADVPLPFDADTTVSPTDPRVELPTAAAPRHMQAGAASTSAAGAALRRLPRTAAPVLAHSPPSVASDAARSLRAPRTASTASSAIASSSASNANVSTQSVPLTPPIHRRHLPPIALHRTQLARTGSGGSASRRQAHTAKYLCTGDASPFTAAGGAAAAAAAAAGVSLAAVSIPPALAASAGGARGGRIGSTDRTAAVMLPVTYFTLLGQAGTTK